MSLTSNSLLLSSAPVAADKQSAGQWPSSPANLLKHLPGDPGTHAVAKQGIRAITTHKAGDSHA